MTLDGELFGGRGKFQSTVSIVKTPGSGKWKDIKFHVSPIFISLSNNYILAYTTRQKRRLESRCRLFTFALVYAIFI